MDFDELAIAAADDVAETSSQHRETSAGKVASSRSSPNATGGHMEGSMANNAIDNGAASAQETNRSLSATPGIESQSPELLESEIQATLDLQPVPRIDSQSKTDGHDGVSTPPTSTSDGFSSQSTNQDLQLSQLSQLSHVAATQKPLTNVMQATRPNLSIAPTAGHKRTADGQVKAALVASGASSTSPNGPPAHGHSRNTSAVSNVSSTTSSRIGELSSELRTRLSYAMIKVNNGWQSNSIDEVESLASQKGSPTSSSSTLNGRRHLFTSPRTAIADIQGQSNSISQPTNPVTQAQSGDFDLYSRNDPPSRTYESFWRDHSTTNSVPFNRQSHVPILSPPPSKLSLAPSADIRPTPSSRRSGTPKFSKPPAMPGQSSSGHSLNVSTPRTPNRVSDFNDAAIQTPTQKTIQEQDAIETLLFMSSPGNSGNMGHAFPPRSGGRGSPQHSPLRAEFGIHARGVQGIGARLENGIGSASSNVAGGVYNSGRIKMSGKATAGGGKSKEDAIDQLLDEMGDSSSDDEELVLNYSSPRRIAAGRV